MFSPNERRIGNHPSHKGSGYRLPNTRIRQPCLIWCRQCEPWLGLISCGLTRWSVASWASNLTVRDTGLPPCPLDESFCP